MDACVASRQRGDWKKYQLFSESESADWPKSKAKPRDPEHWNGLEELLGDF
jgi:hypothetical protein